MFSEVWRDVVERESVEASETIGSICNKNMFSFRTIFFITMTLRSSGLVQNRSAVKDMQPSNHAGYRFMDNCTMQVFVITSATAPSFPIRHYHSEVLACTDWNETFLVRLKRFYWARIFKKLQDVGNGLTVHTVLAGGAALPGPGGGALPQPRRYVGVARC